MQKLLPEGSVNISVFKKRRLCIDERRIAA